MHGHLPVALADTELLALREAVTLLVCVSVALALVVTLPVLDTLGDAPTDVLALGLCVAVLVRVEEALPVVDALVLTLLVLVAVAEAAGCMSPDQKRTVQQ